MANSVYPNQLDDDSNLPRVDDNITEIGGEAINGLREAVFNIEETLGTTPQGTTADVTTRLNQSLNADGTIKASALSSIGLVTLPITNSQVASNAGIEESKLDLDYSTAQLKTWRDELWVFVNNIYVKLSTYINHLNQHTAHPSDWGVHQTQDIDGYTGKYLSYNLQGIVSDLDTRIIDHLADILNAHNASSIFVDDSELSFQSENVQTAIQELNNYDFNFTKKHIDNQHSNGILSKQEIKLNNQNYSELIVSSTAVFAINAGIDRVIFQTTPTNIGKVSRGDIAKITIGSQIFDFYIKRVDILSDTIYLFSKIPIGGNGTVEVYKSTEEDSAPSVLKTSIRQASITTTGGSIIQLIHPSSPFIISNGMDLRKLNSSEKNISIKWDSGETGEIDVYSMMQTFNTKPSTWTPENFVKELNSYFRSESPQRHFPLIAFEYNGEFGIAFDEPNGYVEIVIPSDSAWSILGMEEDKAYSIGKRKFYIDGYEYSDIRLIVDSTGTTNGSTTISNIGTSLDSVGVSSSGLVRVKNHTTDDGTYVFNSNSDNTVTITEHSSNFSTDNVDVKIYSDYFSILIAPTRRTLYELFVDGYEIPYAELKGSQRVEYVNTPGYSTNNPESWFDIISVSRTFLNCERRIYFDGTNQLTFGERGSLGAVDNPGKSVILPSTNADGYRFKLYDESGIDYIEIEIVNSSGYASATTNSIDVYIYDRISEERYVQISTVLHDKSEFKHLIDTRIYGTTGRKNVGDDFKRDYISYPRSILRGNGVIYGFSVDISGGKVDIEGGQLLVNGSILSIEKTELKIPEDGIISTYNLFSDSNGIMRLLKDNYYEYGILITPSLNEIINSNDKLIIAQIEVDASNNITEYKDFRRFVGNIDNKIELLVEENDITHGSFASLKSAANYINGHGNSPIPRIIKIRGKIYHDVTDGAVTLPNGVILQGDNNGNGLLGDGYGSQIVLQGTGTSFIIPGQNCVIKNIHITSDAGSSVTSIFGNSTINLKNFTIDNCVIKNVESGNILLANSLENCYINCCNFKANSVSSNYFININDYVSNLTIENNYITLVSGEQFIVVAGSIENISIKNNNINSDTSAGRIFYFSGTMSQIIIDNNYFNLAGCISVFDFYSTSEDVIISKNIIKLTETSSDSLFNISGASNKINIVNNIIYGNLNNQMFIEMVSPTSAIINENYIENTITTGSALNNMISISGSPDMVSITNNILKNSNSTLGNLIGIYISDGTNINISNNNIHQFEALFNSRNIYIYNCSKNIISNNVCTGNTRVCYINNCNNNIINNNYFESYDKCALYSNNSNNSNIYGNYFKSSSEINQAKLVIISNGSSGEDNIINNNIFETMNTVANTSTFCMLEITNTTGSIRYNTFINKNGGDYNTYIINAYWTWDVIIAFNDLKNVNLNPGWTSTKIQNNITNGSIDYHNWGQQYTVVLNNYNIAQNGSGTSSWYFTIDFDAGSGFVPSFISFVSFHTNYDLNNNEICFSFSAETIPVGSTLDKIEVKYYLSDVTSLDTLRMGWFKRHTISWTTLDTITNMTAVSNKNGCYTHTINPGSTQIMKDYYEYFLVIGTYDTSPTWTTCIYGAKITYTL